MALNSLAQRVVTALALVAVLLPAFLFMPKVFGQVLIALLIAGAAWEWSAFLGSQTMLMRSLYVALVAVMLGVAHGLVPAVVPVDLVNGASMAWWLIAFILILRFPVKLGAGAAAVGGLLVLVPAGIGLNALLETEVGGRRLLLLVLAIVWAADVGAYFTGRRLGRVKLAPGVSPGKTWEGVIGGLLLAALTAVAGAQLLLDQPTGPAVILGLSVAAISVVGDLTVSMFKRNVGLKDSGNLFPGHGGILDRFDSVTAAAPLFVLEAGWLGWLGN